jgi:APA family basic amino acid/polyamine antiporter
MVGGEVQDSRRTLPWALTAGVLIVVGLYVAVNLAYLHALPLREILTANSTAHPTASSVASRAAVAALGPRAGTILPLLFLISAVGALHSNMLTVPRVLFSMARDSLLPTGLARVSAIARTPAVAIVTLASVGSILAVLGGYDRLANMAAFGYVLFYALNAMGLLWWRHRQRGMVASAPGRRWIAALFLAGMLWLLVTITMRGSFEIVAALLLMALGFPVFAYMRHRRLSDAVDGRL